MLHRITLTAAAALLAAGPVLAGDIATPVVIAAPVIVPVAPVMVSNDWSGAYIGGQLGFGRLSTGVTSEGEGGEELEDDAFEGEGALFGVHAGYMFDFGRLVLGGELDWDRSQMDISIVNVPDDGVGEIDSIARAKFRLGFDAGRVLPYVTAGLARASATFEEDAAPSELEETYYGRFIGAGASFAVNQTFMVGLEALRHDFGNAPTFVDDDFVPIVEFDTVVNTVTLRGSFRF